MTGTQKSVTDKETQLSRHSLAKVERKSFLSPSVIKITCSLLLHAEQHLVYFFNDGKFQSHNFGKKDEENIRETRCLADCLLTALVFL